MGWPVRTSQRVTACHCRSSHSCEPVRIVRPSGANVSQVAGASAPNCSFQVAVAQTLNPLSDPAASNAPSALNNKVTNSVQILSGPAGVGAATLLGSEVGGSAATVDTRTDGSVDFVLGNGFTDLLDPTSAASALAAATKPSPSASALPNC